MPAFTLVHRDGERTDDPPLEAIGPLLREVTDGSGAVQVHHGSGWVLTIRSDGVVVFGHAKDQKIPDRFVTDQRVPAMVDLAIAIAVGSLYESLDHEWREGPVPPFGEAS
ncbi:hypothetical protein [Patulibacter minatonensis]|uniref:hypothetical protein n=1 Tax=Patulibacter minatonensis TaxID=298163 RepID=UPI00047E3859|nr:hypothetical protein [Patulibacter minatonensis]